GGALIDEESTDGADADQHHGEQDAKQHRTRAGRCGGFGGGIDLGRDGGSTATGDALCGGGSIGTGVFDVLSYTEVVIVLLRIGKHRVLPRGDALTDEVGDDTHRETEQ